MQGRRTHPDPASGIHNSEPGDYFKDENGTWRGQTPNGLYVWLKNHSVVEHSDGTITVSPSILVSNGTGNKNWHGYLKSGVWEEI